MVHLQPRKCNVSMHAETFLVVFDELRETITQLTQESLSPSVKEVLQSHVGLLYDLLTRLVACPSSVPVSTIQ